MHALHRLAIEYGLANNSSEVGGLLHARLDACDHCRRVRRTVVLLRSPHQIAIHQIVGQKAPLRIFAAQTSQLSTPRLFLPYLDDLC